MMKEKKELKRIVFVPDEIIFIDFKFFIGEVMRLVKGIEGQDIFSVKDENNEVKEVIVEVEKEGEGDVLAIFSAYGWHIKNGDQEDKKKKGEKLQRKREV